MKLSGLGGFGSFLIIDSILLLKISLLISCISSDLVLRDCVSKNLSISLGCLFLFFF